MITVLISLFVFGGVALYFYEQLTAKSDELQPMQSATTRISDEDIGAMLFVLDPDTEDRRNAVMMLRFDPVRKQIFCIGIPLDLQVSHEGRSMSVDACYENHGLEALKNAVSKLLDQEIGHYMKMDSNGFQKLVNLIGNVQYVVTVRDTGLQPSESYITLDNEQFETLLTSNKYSSEEERSNVIGGSVAQLLNQCIGETENSLNTNDLDGGARVAHNLDSYFSTVINGVTTDITAMDFQNHKHAISYVFEYAAAPARGMGIICDEQDGILVPNQVFLDNLKITFYQLSADSSNHNTQDNEE